MKCQRYESSRILSVGCKCSDRFGCTIKSIDYDGYVPNDLGIGGGDYIEFDLCLDCGQVQGTFPLPQAHCEKDIEDEDLIDFFDNHFVEGEMFSDIHASNRHIIIKAARELSYNLTAYNF